MASSLSYHLHLLPLFLLVALLTLLPFITCATNDLVISRCSKATNDKQSIPSFAEKMSFDLLNLAPQNGFAYTHHSVSGLYGLAWCRGDFSADRCSKCLSKAAKKLVYLCTHQAIVARLLFHDFCYLRLDVEGFLTKLDTSFGRIWYDHTEEKIAEAHRMNAWDSVRRLMGELKKTIPKENKKRFAKMEVSFEKEDSKIYGMGQCVKGINGRSCKVCLDQAMEGMEAQCIYRRACEVFYGSCFLRYKIRRN